MYPSCHVWVAHLSPFFIFSYGALGEIFDVFSVLEIVVLGLMVYSFKWGNLFLLQFLNSMSIHFKRFCFLRLMWTVLLKLLWHHWRTWRPLQLHRLQNTVSFRFVQHSVKASEGEFHPLSYLLMEWDLIWLQICFDFTQIGMLSLKPSS